MFNTVIKAMLVLYAATAFVTAASADTIYLNTSGPVAKGAAALKAGNLDEAIRLSLKATKKSQPAKRRAVAHNNLCIAYYLKRDYDEAVGHCDASIRAKRNFWQAYVNRGNAYLEMGDADRAVGDYERARKINPKLDVIDENLELAQAQQAFQQASLATAQ